MTTSSSISRRLEGLGNEKERVKREQRGRDGIENGIIEDGKLMRKRGLKAK